MKNYIGRRVRLTKEYAKNLPVQTENSKYTEGIVILTPNDKIWRVKLDNGQICSPYNPSYNYAQCELIEETVSNMEQYKVKNLVDKTAIHYSTEEEWKQVLQIMEDSGIRWASGNTAIYRADNWGEHYDTIVYEEGVLYHGKKKRWEEQNYTIIKANTFIQANSITMIQEAPRTVTIKSDNPTLLKAFWEDIQKLGYSHSDGTVGNTPDKQINHNWNDPESKEQWKSIYVANNGVNGKVQYTLPVDYVTAYTHLKEGMEWWEKKESTPQYKVDDWVVVTKNSSSCRNIGYVGQITEVDKYDNSKCRIGPGMGNWSRTEELRPATPEEIKAAQIKTVLIGDKQLKVTISNGSIKAENLAIDPNEIRDLINSMRPLTQKVGAWTATIPPAIASIGCCSGVTLAQLKEIVAAYEELTN